MQLFNSPFHEPMIPKIRDEDIQRAETDIAIYVIARNAGEGKDRQLWECHCNSKCLRSNRYEVSKTAAGDRGSASDESVRKYRRICTGGRIDRKGVTERSPDNYMGQTIPRLSGAESYSFLDDEFYREGIYVGYRYLTHLMLLRPIRLDMER